MVKIKLTVGEGEAWSDITFRDSCMKATNKKDSEGWETEPSHAHCPHASSGPPANLHYLPFRFLGNSWRAFFLSRVYFLSRSLFPAPRLLEWRVCALSLSQTPSGRQKMMLVWTICDLRTRQKASSDQLPCVHVTAGSQPRSVMMKEKDKKLVICIIKLFWENYYSRWLIKQNYQRLWFQLLNYEDLLLFFVTCISRLSLNLPKQTDRQCKHLRMSPQKTTVFHFSFHPPWTKPGDLWLVVFQPNDQQQGWHSKYKLC